MFYIFFSRQRVLYYTRSYTSSSSHSHLFSMLAEKKKEKGKENKEGKFNNIYTESMEDSPIVGESKGIVDKSWS